MSATPSEVLTCRPRHTPNEDMGRYSSKQSPGHAQRRASWADLSTSTTKSSGIIPYLQLIRLDRPKGFFYFWFPHIFGSILGAIVLKQPLEQLVQVNGILIIGTFFLRSATCAWNDIVDAPFDRQVTRTKNRPMARGAIDTNPALLYTAVLSTFAFAVLAWLPPVCTIYAIPAIVGWFVYPLSKRVTNYPQVVLGFPMAWGIFMGAAAVGADPLQIHGRYWFPSSHTSSDGTQLPLDARNVFLYFYAANFAWTLCYEIIYSFQDVRDDVDAGVLNIALLLGKRGAKPFLVVAAAVVVSGFAHVGELMHAGWFYYYGCVIAAAIILATKIFSVDLSNPQNCSWWFSNGGIITGTAITAGLFLEYLDRRVYY